MALDKWVFLELFQPYTWKLFHHIITTLFFLGPTLEHLLPSPVTKQVTRELPPPDRAPPGHQDALAESLRDVAEQLQAQELRQLLE